MIRRSNFIAFSGVLLAGVMLSSQSIASEGDRTPNSDAENSAQIQLGPRPFFLIDDMDSSALKEKLQSCKSGPFYRSDFSIGHRGAPMQFPEHTKESYLAAAKMGAGILECDVTFTKDKALVCRHSQCDLHTTTNIVATELGAKCSQPFKPATFDAAGKQLSPASASCCTSDITLAEFKTLKGKMDAANTSATTAEEFLGGTANWRTDLYASRGTLMTHKESIALFKQLGTKMTPELKSPSVNMPFNGFTQQQYAQKLINEYQQMGVDPRDVYPQSFNLEDVVYWIKENSAFGQQAVYLDGRYDDSAFDFRDPSTWQPSMNALADQGVKIIAPPMWMLVDLDRQGAIVPSLYSERAKAAGLNIITWTLERSGHLASGGGWYYQSTSGKNSRWPELQGAINNDGDMMVLMDVLAKDVGVLGIFSDWPATTTYYANCMGLK